MDQGQWKARVAIWQRCTPAVPILGGRISRHLRYACASHFNNIFSHHCLYTDLREGDCNASCFCILFNIFMWAVVVGRNSSVGIATCYGLDGPEIESGGARFSAPVQTGPGSHPAYVQWVPGLSQG
jgi:hypothetical protein